MSPTLDDATLDQPGTGRAVPAASTLQAVLFDMDGLLVDTEPQWYEAELETVTRLGGSVGPCEPRRAARDQPRGGRRVHA